MPGYEDRPRRIVLGCELEDRARRIVVRYEDTPRRIVLGYDDRPRRVGVPGYQATRHSEAHTSTTNATQRLRGYDARRLAVRDMKLGVGA